ncbi:unnamed protein product [Angiostrongylus costaricensis]|uniref:Phosducin domain-containing protein n=1 Tax=Angiostrongylus costaricensis TaxID=334426 RepID=A0A158PGM0_ANGCS|nr:unnamed protein product [Angiostrongylus costaricensis]
MASLESKLLDGSCVGYCSSSDEDEEAWTANVMRMLGPSTNTGVKGVLNEFAAEQERSKKARKARDREIRGLAQKGMLQRSKAEREGEQFLKAIETCDCLICVLIYKPNDEMCERATHVCKVLAADYPSVRFVRASSTLLEMSKSFSDKALPAFQFYLNGNLVGNFIQMSSMLGGEIDVSSVKKFFKRQHIDLVHGTYITDSEHSTDEDIN